MNLEFLKMHGLGNDFVIFDMRSKWHDLSATQIRNIADRHLGVGCDQMVMLSPPQQDGDVFMHIYNADGGEVGACGNVTRCVGYLLLKEAADKQQVAIETVEGILFADRTGDTMQITVNMGQPRFDAENIPMQGGLDHKQIDLAIADLPPAIAVGVGNPHCVFFVDDAEAIDIEKHGPIVEHANEFPERTNVEFVSVETPSRLRMRVWERGAGVTQACGTGACATLVAAVVRGLSERQADIILDGGVLNIAWDTETNDIMMTGPVAFVYQGVIDLDNFSG